MKILITLLGWLAWNAVMFRLEKDKYDERGEKFDLRQFAQKNWDNWLVGLCGAALLLVVGQEVLHVINLTENTELEWKDSWYGGSGPFTEMIIYAVKKWKAKKEAA